MKRVLKYAPLKSDFVRGIAQDETVKTEISEDMYSVPAANIEADSEENGVVDAEYTEIPETDENGEIIGEA